MIKDDMRRQEQLLRCIPDVASYQTLFYIGAHGSRMQMLPIFINAQYKIDIIEIFEPNYQELIEFNRDIGVFRETILGDIRMHRFQNSYDVIMWWHGPEHVEREEFLRLLPHLESAAMQYVVLACPWGEYNQLSEKNPYEQHKLAFFPKDFADCGYQTDVIGQENVPGSNLLSWKRIGK